MRVGQRDPRIVEEDDEGVPLVDGVGDRLAEDRLGRRSAGEVGDHLAQPIHERPAARLSPTQELVEVGPVDAGLSSHGVDIAEQRYDHGGPGVAGIERLVGKSGLAADAPDTIFLNVEDGLGELDVSRYLFRDEDGGDIPRSLSELCTGIDDLVESNHDFRNVAIDTIDALESRLLWPHVVVSTASATAASA